MHGKFYEVRAHIAEITGLSAHADQSELIEWVKNMKFLPSRLCFVHGESSALEALRVKIQTDLQVPVKILKKDEEIILTQVE